MANVTTPNGIIALIGNGFSEGWLGYNESTTARSTLFSGNVNGQRATYFAFPGGITTPTFPGSTTGYLPTEVTAISTAASSTPYILAELINLGSLNLNGGGGGSFTDGSAMPTRTTLGTSRVIDSPIIAEVTTVLSAAPGTFTLTVTDDTGASVSSNAMTPANSSAVGSIGFIAFPSGNFAARDITAASTTGTGTGVIQFWGMIPISSQVLNPGAQGASFTDDLISQGRIMRLGSGKTIGGFQIGGVGAMATNMRVNVLGEQ